MYRIAIVRKGQPAECSTVDSGGALRDAVWALIRAEGSTITDADHSGLIALVSDARSMADTEGFAAIEFGTAALTIRPGTTDDDPADALPDPGPLLTVGDMVAALDAGCVLPGPPWEQQDATPNA